MSIVILRKFFFPVSHAEFIEMAERRKSSMRLKSDESASVKYIGYSHLVSRSKITGIPSGLDENHHDYCDSLMAQSMVFQTDLAEELTQEKWLSAVLIEADISKKFNNGASAIMNTISHQRLSKPRLIFSA